MKRSLAIIITIMLCACPRAGAQTFLDRLRTQKAGQGSVSVNQSTEIDKLVNGPNATPDLRRGSSPEEPAPSEDAGAYRESTRVGAPHEEPAPRDNADTLAANRKKVLANSYKVDGYRVQVYAGGNTKKDKQAAEKAGEDVKKQMPDQPIYVHFYSPRWICRVGNFRSYEEAHKVLMEIREMGYSQASIVKGKISVQY